MYRRITIPFMALIVAVIATSFISCDKNSVYETGFLKGKISIGPLCPVEKDPPDPACIPTAETYKAYPVSIWSADGKSRIASLNPSIDGAYGIELNQGSYLVKLENVQTAIGGSNLPTVVIIFPNHDTELNIGIDTGIR